MIWFSPHTTYGYAVDGGEGDIHSDFDTSGIVLDMCQSCNILVQGSNILNLVLCYDKDYIPVL